MWTDLDLRQCDSRLHIMNSVLSLSSRYAVIAFLHFAVCVSRTDATCT